MTIPSPCGGVVSGGGPAIKDAGKIGRTHGIHAEPLTVGLELPGWYDELARARTRLEHCREEMAVGAFSGAVGTHAYGPPSV